MKKFDELLERTPSLQPEWVEMMNRIGEHKHAPLWNSNCGDRMELRDLIFVSDFEKALETRSDNKKISRDLFHWLHQMKHHSWWFEDKLRGINGEKEFHRIPCMRRSDLQHSLEIIVPHSISLKRLIINPTSGTTGQPILCPNHPKSVGCYDPMIQFMLRKHQVIEHYDWHKMAAIQLCAQRQTMTYFTVHSALNGAGFAKINIMAEQEWPEKDSVHRFIEDFQPVFLSGDPFAFEYALKTGLKYQPKAILSTATTLNATMRETQEKAFSCPVINFYSLNETGPIAYSCPNDPASLHLLPHDIHVEILDESNAPVTVGTIGEITVTGGRNPYLPLLRYRTGDLGSIRRSVCSCGDPHPQLTLHQSRETIALFDRDFQMVNPVDINRILREYPVQAHQMKQKSDTTCTLDLAFFHDVGQSVLREIEMEILALFPAGIDLKLSSNLDPKSKWLPFSSDVERAQGVS